MPCRTEVCNVCGKYECRNYDNRNSTFCEYQKETEKPKFNYEGRFCDLMNSLKDYYPKTYSHIINDKDYEAAFFDHLEREKHKLEEKEKKRKFLLSRLSAEEKELLGIKD